MEFKAAVLVGSMASVATYFWTIRIRLIPKTIKKLRVGSTLTFHAQDSVHSHYLQKSREMKTLLRLVEFNALDNKYYILCGKKGVGKTTLCEQVIATLGSQQGILYVKAEQTPNLHIFNRALSKAINLNLVQKKLVAGSILTNLWRPDASQVSELDDLMLILNHLEEALEKFAQRRYFKKPTLIIDHITYLADNNPKALTALQSKAKFWADHNLMTVVFVGTDGRAPLLLEENSDKVRMNFIEIRGPGGSEAVDFVYEELQKLKGIFFKGDDVEFFNSVGRNILEHYNRHMRPKATPALTELNESATKEVLLYLIQNYIGGGFLDLRYLLEELRNGKTIAEIEELFLRRAYSDLLDADLLFEEPFNPHKFAILRSIKRLYLSPKRELSYREFRQGTDEKNLHATLSKNVFFLNRASSTVKFQYPAFERFIAKEIDLLDRAIALDARLDLAARRRKLLRTSDVERVLQDIENLHDAPAPVERDTFTKFREQVTTPQQQEEGAGGSQV